MKICENYHLANSIDDALNVMGDSLGDSRLIAGGTDLLLDIQQGRHPPVHTLIDVSEIPEMTTLEVRGDSLFIGAAVVHRVIHESPLVSKHCYALREACGLIGGSQVRNTATIGGNVAHALPAADGTIALTALDAKAEVVSISENKIVPITELFLGPGKSILKQNNAILIGFYVDLIESRQASAFSRIMRPQGVAIAILNTAIWLQRKGDIIDDIRIAVGPSGPVPRRMNKTEDVLRSKLLNDEIMHQAHQVLLSEAHFRTSPHRTSKTYREKMAGVLLKQAAYEAFTRSQFTDGESF
jgi:carbon-monoxide dehydrogenase medium subunit